MADQSRSNGEGEGPARRRWEERYAQGDLPWDTGVADGHLVRLVSRWPRCGGAALDVGCGTGTNLVWLARQGFTVTGIDLAEQAVARARQRCAETGVRCRLLCDDFLTSEALSGQRFDFVFDRGCFHAMREPEARKRFADRVAGLLRQGGVWFSLSGNADDTWQEGPPRLRAADIVAAVEPRFEILLLESVPMTDSRGRSPRFWQCLARRRAKS